MPLRRRAALRPVETPQHFDLGPEREAFKRTRTSDTHAALTVLLARLQVHWRCFVKSRQFEAMRAQEAAGAAPDFNAALRQARQHYPGIPA